MEALLDSCFHAAERVSLAFFVVVVFRIFHGRAGKHSFRPDRATGRAMYIVPTGRDDVLKRVTIQTGSPRSSVRDV